MKKIILRLTLLSFVFLFNFCTADHVDESVQSKTKNNITKQNTKASINKGGAGDPGNDVQDKR